MEQVMARVDQRGGPDGCWLWNGAHNDDGYGHVRWHGPMIAVHRLLWVSANGPVPEGLVLDHFACDNRACVNPKHVQPVTFKANVLRGTGPTAINAAKAQCVHGHDLTDPENLYPSRRQRVCKTCSLRAARAYTARKKAFKEVA